MARTLTTALAIAAVAFPATASSSTAPSLTLLQRAPLQVRGSHFKAREGVVVTASTLKERVSVKIRTTRRGQFVVRFAHFATDTCAPITIKAVGAKRDSAKLVVQPPPSELPCRM